MTLEIISAQEIVYRGEADMVQLPGELGSFTVLKNHASLISVLTPGKIRHFKEGGQENEVEIKGGLADVDNNVISVCIY